MFACSGVPVDRVSDVAMAREHVARAGRESPLEGHHGHPGRTDQDAREREAPPSGGRRLARVIGHAESDQQAGRQGERCAPRAEPDEPRGADGSRDRQPDGWRGRAGRCDETAEYQHEHGDDAREPPRRGERRRRRRGGVDRRQAGDVPDGPGAIVVVERADVRSERIGTVTEWECIGDHGRRGVTCPLGGCGRCPRESSAVDDTDVGRRRLHRVLERIVRGRGRSEESDQSDGCSQGRSDASGTGPGRQQGAPTDGDRHREDGLPRQADGQRGQNRTAEQSDSQRARHPCGEQAAADRERSQHGGGDCRVIEERPWRAVG